MGKKLKTRPRDNVDPIGSYEGILTDVVELLERARRTSARAVNAVMTATYWEIGRRIVEFEQRGERRAKYGAQIIGRLSQDLTHRFGRGFSKRNVEQMRQFYLCWPIAQTVSAQSPLGLPPPDEAAKAQTVPAQSEGAVAFSTRFPLPWSHYVKLLSVSVPDARMFYEEEALRGGWSVRTLERQISTKFYERTMLSRNKAAMLRRGRRPRPDDELAADEEVKDSYILEFLDLKDEYSESDLEDALIRKLEHFLLELGEDFAFIGRQRRLRVGDEWYRIDLLFFHRRLRCLVVIDLKLDKFTHADAGQMHLYLNYASEHWTQPGENPPVGLILCAKRDDAVAHYALEGLPNTVLAAEYRLALPDEKLLAEELERTRRLLEQRGLASPRLRNTGKKSARRKETAGPKAKKKTAGKRRTKAGRKR
ncbi:MAG: DUF1016 domain-containing protein [Planctomycetes bacterium]|nr:DUF1016 domain-containing protein [Planctomycetota bacterium]MBL7043335.1 DUF1016 family protein [Pirellulaceae bacterium]